MGPNRPDNIAHLPDVTDSARIGADTSDGRELRDRILTAVSASPLQLINETSSNVRTTLEGFDLDEFEILEKASYRELVPEDLESFGALYKALEMDSGIFYAMYDGDIACAEERASEGGMIHRWRNNEKEKKVQKKICPRCKFADSADEFHSFLKGTHGRSADFRAWGMFADEGKELIATASFFLPPYHDRTRLKRHAGELESFFRRRKGRFEPDPHADVQEICRRVRTTAEFYMIAAKKRGAATFVIQKALKQMQQEGIPLTDMYLLRFGSLRMVYPHEDKRVAHDAPNMASRRFFRRRGFGDCAQCVNKCERAIREIQGGIVIAAEPKWTVMHASFDDFLAENTTEMKYLIDLARNARKTRTPKKQ